MQKGVVGSHVCELWDLRGALSAGGCELMGETRDADASSLEARDVGVGVDDSGAFEDAIALATRDLRDDARLRQLV